MVKRKTPRKTARSAAPARRIYRRRAKSGTQYIPAAMATAGLVMANAAPIKDTLQAIQNRGVAAAAKDLVKFDYKKYINYNQLVKDAMYYAGGYVGGEVVKKYAPAVIKTPLGKLAKKIPRL